MEEFGPASQRKAVLSVRERQSKTRPESKTAENAHDDSS